MFVDFSVLRRSIQDKPGGEEMCAVAVDAALSFLQRDGIRMHEILRRFYGNDAERLKQAFDRYFDRTEYPKGTPPQTIQDSPQFRNWQANWMPGFIRGCSGVKGEVAS